MKTLKKISLEAIFKDFTVEDKLNLLIKSLNENEKVEFSHTIHTTIHNLVYKKWKRKVEKTILKKFLQTQNLNYVWNCFQFQQKYKLDFDIVKVENKYWCSIFSVLDEQLYIKINEDGQMYIDTQNKQPFCKYDTNLLRKQ